MNVRTRVAPSPTGDPHVGTAYIALFNLAFARSQGGEFVLRIEDTDRERSTRAAEERIIRSLHWLGLDWDEGPQRGGPYGPYRQSERSDRYTHAVRTLLEHGHAFRCFCSPERLAEVRRAQQQRKDTPRYDGRCLGLQQSEVERCLAAGEPSVVRMKVPDTGTCRIEDYFRGTLEFDYAQVDMQVLLKSDGQPTYHLANVVDDHAMEITHVIRGEEWLPSAPKHVLLYAAFGWEPPTFAHLPLLRNPDRSKLSKRKNPTSVEYYRRLGYLPEALVNFLGLMGYSMPDEREQFALEEMIGAFNLDRVRLGAPIFDLDKLAWLNGQWLRGLTDAQFADRVAEWALNRDYLMRIVPLVKDRTESFSELVNLAGYLVGDTRALTPGSFEHSKLGAEDVRRILQFALWRLEAVEHWERETLVASLTELAEAMGLRIREFLFPLFVAIAGRAVALPLYDSLEILGSDIARHRLRDALAVLGAPSQKEQKRLEKAYQSLSHDIDFPASRS